jgi:AcrR family transcriptional regulator
VREERRSVYRQAINEAAERVFAAKGADGSRMDEIAAEAGISLGTLYGVIDGKKSLFFGIHKTRMQEFMDCIRAASTAYDETLPCHLAVVRLGAQYFLERPDFLRMCCRAGFGWASRFPASGPGADLWEEGSRIPRDLFIRGIAEGIFVDEDPDLLVRKMLALKQVELTHWVDRGMETPHEEVLERLESQFLRAFRTPTPGSQPGPGARKSR